MKAKFIFIQLIVLIVIQCCRFTNNKIEKIESPSGKYYLNTTIDHAAVLINLYSLADSPRYVLSTRVGDFNKWAVGWDKSKDTIILFSSDIGTQAWRIENERPISINITEEIEKRANELKLQKYK